jgi:ABC-type transporter Mla subunit MlaD
VRRLATILAVLALAGGVAAILLSSTAQGSSSATFNVIFDDARGLIAGQLVKVAGAQAGSIQNVTVIKQGSGAQTSYKAKIEGTIESQFMPFRTNATCTIRPQGLIAENYVECDPGSPPAPILRGTNGQPPTVPVQNTSEPVSLLDLFNIFNVPTRERFALILDELGIGTAGEGQNFNDILYRANPALKLADQVIGILAHQKAQLATIIDATNTIAQQGAGHTADVQHFLTQAAALSSITADHSSNLQLAINRLPGLLAAAQPSLQQLDIVAKDGTPLLQQLHVAAPYLNQVSTDLVPFVASAKPGLAKLSTALDTAIPAVEHTTPVVKALKNYTNRSLAKTQLAGRLFTSLQQSGFLENFLGIIYYVGAAVSRYDSISHLLDFTLLNINNGACIAYATTPVPGCEANYGSVPSSAAGRARAGSSGAARRAQTASATHATAPTPSTSRPPQQSSAQASQAAPQSPSSSGGVGGLLQSLLGGGSTSSTSTTPTQTTPPSTGGSGSGSSSNPLQNLLNYLLK